MRIAAGVLIIIASIFNLVAGIGYGLGGLFVTGGSKLVDKIAQDAAKQGGDPNAIKQLQTAGQKADQVGTAVGGALMAFGFFLLVMFGLAIAAGVVLFREKAATFALIVGVLQLIAEVVGLILTSFASVLFTIPGIVAGIFVIIAAVGYRGKSDMSAMAAP